MKTIVVMAITGTFAAGVIAWSILSPQPTVKAEPAKKPAPTTAAAPRPEPTPAKTIEEMKADAIRLELPVPPAADATPEQQKEYLAKLDEVSKQRDNPKAAEARKLRRDYARLQHDQQSKARREASKKKHDEQRATRDASRPPRPERPPRDPNKPTPPPGNVQLPAEPVSGVEKK